MKYAQFKELHQSGNPVIIANVWDAHSAKLAEKAGCAALGTSSHAISNMIGLEDGNNITFEQTLFFIKGIAENANIPVSVDIESGYGEDAATIVANIKTLADLGVVGINLEDSEIKDGARKLRPLYDFSALLKDIVAGLQAQQINMFINLRTDTYLTKHPQAVNETIARGKAYKAIGVDGLFVPLIKDKEEIEKVIQEAGLPLNVFATKDGPTYEEFVAAGVHRISSGDAAYAKTMKTASSAYQALAGKNLKGLFD